MKRKLDVSSIYSSSSAAGSSSTEASNSISTDGDATVNPWTYIPYSPKYYDILKKRKALPVYQFHADLLEKVRNNQIVVVEGETGSGKTTQIPQVRVAKD